MNNEIKYVEKKRKGLFGIIGEAIRAVVIGLLIFGGVCFAGGVAYGNYVWGTEHTQPSFSEELQKQNELIQKSNEQYMIDIGMTKSEIESLKNYNANLKATNERLVNEQINNSVQINFMKSELASKDREIARLKELLNNRTYSASTTISSNTPVQTVQITPSTSTATYAPAFNYGSWVGRPTYPSIKYFATVTDNVIKFTEGKTFEQIVDDIRELRYISHVNDNSNYAIQYADETLVIGGGDCTDKVLLLYACMKAKGYSEDDMAVVSIHSCDGGYDHNVLAMTKPPFDATGVDAHYTFDIGGRKWYIIDPTNWAGTPMCSVMGYYEDCYIVGNMHFYNTDTLGGWDEVPMHGLKVKR
jgi:predicted transglutaminase-like cysteine proteinase